MGCPKGWRDRRPSCPAPIKQDSPVQWTMGLWFSLYSGERATIMIGHPGVSLQGIDLVWGPHPAVLGNYFQLGALVYRAQEVCGCQKWNLGLLLQIPIGHCFSSFCFLTLLVPPAIKESRTLDFLSLSDSPTLILLPLRGQTTPSLSYTICLHFLSCSFQFL